MAAEPHENEIARNIDGQGQETNDSWRFSVVYGIETTTEHMHAPVKRQAEQVLMAQ